MSAKRGIAVAHHHIGTNIPRKRARRDPIPDQRESTEADLDHKTGRRGDPNPAQNQAESIDQGIEENLDQEEAEDPLRQKVNRKAPEKGSPLIEETLNM